MLLCFVLHVLSHSMGSPKGLGRIRSGGRLRVQHFDKFGDGLRSHRVGALSPAGGPRLIRGLRGESPELMGQKGGLGVEDGSNGPEGADKIEKVAGAVQTKLR